MDFIGSFNFGGGVCIRQTMGTKTDYLSGGKKTHYTGHFASGEEMSCHTCKHRYATGGCPFDKICPGKERTLPKEVEDIFGPIFGGKK